MEAERLVSGEGAEALALASGFDDPASLPAATAMRRRFDAELSASALEQVSLRRRARTKFGEQADGLLFTATGLEQATRPAVARWRAQRFADAGVRHVVDLGCGLGTDALACTDAGLRVTAVELDPATAALARANLAGRDAEVLCGDAVELAPGLLDAADTAVFCDPARRTERGRTWRVDQFTPPWDFVLGLLQRRCACIKLGPGLPSELVPDDVEARWVSERGDVVEVGLWQLPGLDAGRAATLLPGGSIGPAPHVELDVSNPLAHVVEPDGALLRAGLAGALPAVLGVDLFRLAPGVGYLTCEPPVRTPFATTFEVLDVLDASEKSLRAWVRDHDIGTLEIKKRAVDLDPAALRRRLKPKGRAGATLMITPTPVGVRALVVRRLPAP